MKLLKLSTESLEQIIAWNRAKFDKAYMEDYDLVKQKECLSLAYELGCKHHIEDLERDMPQDNTAPVIVESDGTPVEYHY